MATFDFKSATPATSALNAGFFFGADSQSDSTPKIYNNTAMRALLLGTTTSTLAIAAGKTLTVSNTLTFTGTDSSSVAFGAGGTVLYSSSAIPLTIGTTTIASGATTRILYDNAGVLGEYTLTGTGTVVAMQTSPSFLTGITTPVATVTQGTITADAPQINGTVTWNSGAVTFTGWKLNVTDAASAVASLLLDLQVGGTRKFAFGKNGHLYGNSAANSLVLTGSTDYANVDFGSTASVCTIFGATGDLALLSTGYLGWSSGFGSSGAETRWYRDAAYTIAQRNGTNAQISRIYNTFTDASNYERLNLAWESNICKIETESLGTGVVRNMQVGGVNTEISVGPGNPVWRFNNSGHFIALVDNAYDIGASGATRPRTLYLGTSIVTPGGASFHTTSTALTDGAAAQVGTLTNAPTAGNPNKWVAINDNGTLRYIPTWIA